MLVRKKQRDFLRSLDVALAESEKHALNVWVNSLTRSMITENSSI